MLGCAAPLPISRFAADGPAFDPVRFFTGHVRSWGVMEDRRGQPTAIVTTDCLGNAEGADSLHMVQTLQIGDDPATTREWHMRRTGPGQYQATANDMVGTATGEAAGRAFHWNWMLAATRGNTVTNVVLDQWWYLQADGSMLNRTMISKFGFIAAEVMEHFAHVD